jgi:dihydroneopterin aldolase
MDKMYIKDLIIKARHGVHSHEKTHSQRFKVSVELTFDMSLASESDDLDNTINWSLLRKTIIETVQNNSFNLIERLAKEVAKNILLEKRIKNVTVSIDKLDAFNDCIPGIKLFLES